MTAIEFKVGDLVTRDGTDVHRVIEVIESDLIVVECVKEPLGYLNEDGTRDPPWTKIGERETNLARRYDFAGVLLESTPGWSSSTFVEQRFLNTNPTRGTSVQPYQKQFIEALESPKTTEIKPFTARRNK